MISISEIIGFNFIVISPTVVLLLTALILLFFTITIPSSDVLKKLITFLGILLTNFFIFLKKYY